jgi:cytochrome c553
MARYRFGSLGAVLGLSAAALVALQPARADEDAAAKALVGPCTGCHSIPNYQASFPRVYRVPKIGGQSEKYLESALQAYKRGERSHPTMTAIARGLTDEQITQVATYFAQRGEAAR